MNPLALKPGMMVNTPHGPGRFLGTINGCPTHAVLHIKWSNGHNFHYHRSDLGMSGYDGSSGWFYYPSDLEPIEPLYTFI